MNVNDRMPNWHLELFQSSQKLLPSSEEVHVLFIIDGACALTMHGETSFLRNMDFLVINVNEEAFLEIEKSAYAALVSIDYFELCMALGQTTVRFNLNSLTESGPQYDKIRFMLIDLLMCFLGSRTADSFQEKGLFCLILQALVDHFRPLDSEVDYNNEREALALEIVRYIRLNFRENISMTDVADKFFLSRSVVSRLFKKFTGENFPTYLKNLRLEAAKKDLEGTDLSVSGIGVENGFSTPSMFSQAFREKYGLTPKEYRKQHCKIGRETVIDEKSSQQVLKILSKTQKLGISNTNEIQVVKAQMDQAEPWKRWRNRMVNAGPFTALQSANMQQQILFLKKKLDIQYLRMWNPFSSQLMLLTGQKGSYNYSTLDEILDFCVDNGLKIFWDLTPRRERALASESREIYSSDTKTEFQSEGKWLSALNSLLLHLRHRYHDEVVNEWIFELTFSLNDRPYYCSEAYDSMRVWQKSCACIKAAMPNVRTAGPGMIVDSHPDKTERDIRRFLTCPYPPDIYTSIHFPYQRSDSFFQGAYKKDSSRFFLDEKLARINSILQHHGFQGEHWVTEWGISLANRSYLQDSCYRGAAIVDALLRSLAKADAIGVFYASDLLNVFTDSGAVLSGCGGLLSRRGIRKPAYYGYRFLRQLGSKCAVQTDHCIVTAENKSDIRILCWNKIDLGPAYYAREEDSFSPEEIGTMFEGSEPYLMELILGDLTDGGFYRVRQRILNQKHGSILDKWNSLGSVQDVSREDIEYLERISTPEIISETQEALHGEIRFTVRLLPNEMRMITISEER